MTLERGVSSKTYTIARGRKPGAWVLYQAHPDGTVIDLERKADSCVVVAADYVIVRGIVCRGARKQGILIGNHRDVVIEGCDISGWGRRETRKSARPYPPDLGVHLDAAIRSEGRDVERLVIQGNRIHHPAYRSSNWTEWSPFFSSSHPQGPKAIVLGPPSAGNHVIRYNDFFSDREHMFNDILFESLGTKPSPGNGLVRDSDIYGNSFSDCWDDAIEVERGDRNVRIWNNYFTRVFKAISAGYDWEGPVYIWRNVSERTLEPHKVSGRGEDTMDRLVAAFLMPSQEKKEAAWSSVLFVYHNTVLCDGGQCDSLAAGNGYDLYDSDSLVRMVSRNNIWQTEQWALRDVFTFSGIRGRYLSEDYDLHNGRFDSAHARGPHAIQGVPRFRPGHGPGGAGNYQLIPGSLGHDAGQVLPNFNDGYEGAAPDVGAHEAGSPTMQFGVDLWSPTQRLLE
ncbi:MAG: hypothetical protein O3A53_17885 [Acidobacteria bacterium]|nr:hypothetical protein [Acidobacteriota bacterium]MDA1236659.1 hypothetical protein [Acidobacteriota bacterium]